MTETNTLNREELREIARHQRAILLCIVGYAVLVALQMYCPQQLKAPVGLAAIGVSITATVFVFLLATRVYERTTGIILGVLTLIPCVGLIELLRVNAYATSVLRSHDNRVGLVGAEASEIN